MIDWLPALGDRDLPFVVLLTGVNVAYLLAHYGFSAARMEQRAARAGFASTVAQTRGVLAKRLYGGVILGGGAVLASIAAGAELPMLWRRSFWPVLVVTLAVAVVVLPLSFRGARSPAMRAQLPEIRGVPLVGALFWRATFAWAVYLFGYECLFRGVLFGFFSARLGVWPGLAASTALYTWAHLHKAWPETLGSVLMGFVFGWMAYVTGGFLAPFLLHLAISVGSEKAAT